MKTIDEIINNIYQRGVPREPSTKPKTIVGLPKGQVSKPDDPWNFMALKDDLNILKPGYQFDVVPLIRKLKDVNPDMGQAFKDVIQLANTGHELIFDPSVNAETQDEIRKEINIAAKTWCVGAPGLHGIVNRMFAQLLIAGAIANEWVPNAQLNDIVKVAFVKPEHIRFKRERNKIHPAPYQQLQNPLIPQSKKLKNLNLIKLNPNTFRYYALGGDPESPYGTPPYLASLSGISTQKRMLENIDHIVSSMGILGWVNALIDKPDQVDGESDKQYETRLEKLLQDMKSRVLEQMRDGVAVGYKDDHEFEFQSTVKDASGIDSLWGHNEQQVASGLQFDAAFMGRSYNTSETMITILFVKMISQLTNMQNTVEHNLTYGLSLFLRLRGYKFEWLKVEFNKSTIADDLKFQQALETKSRVALQLYLMGTIDEYLYARMMGFDKPKESSPRIPLEALAKYKSESPDKENDDKAKDQRKTREKDKATPVRKTKPIKKE